MSAKVRVYELARELDITNKQIIALCESLGIDAKSHSSSLVEAQADRVRKKAESEGLVKLTSPSEIGDQKVTRETSNKAQKAEDGTVEKAPSKAVSSKKPPPKKAKPSSSESGQK
ncbi:MAG TPA: translation initiation factor IF-2 N-terminal domain-containing protein, partial [Acidimicrobiales bacterium]|nr:translation initiation factor IF-2 N-terminal domain-containing protein [Acidimicrobiales bacterium]